MSTAPNLEAPCGGNQVTQVLDGSRNTPRSLLKTARQLLHLFRNVRPDLVVSTGAAPGAIAILLGYCLGARTVWIDTIASCDRLSMSGRLVRRFADLMLTQWEPIAEGYSDVQFYGQVL